MNKYAEYSKAKDNYKKVQERLHNGRSRCASKRIYSQENVAFAINALKRKGHNTQSYLCPICGFYHITHARRKAKESYDTK